MKRGAWQPSSQTYDRGLAGLVMGDTAISRIDGASGELRYRGYAIEDLAREASFEAICLLVLDGALPDARALAAWRGALASWRELPPAAVAAIETFPAGCDPFAAFQTAACVAASLPPRREAPAPAAPRDDAPRILSWTAGLAAAAVRRSRGEAPVPPRDDLDYARHFLFQMNGAEPDPIGARALEVSLIVQAEHGVHAAALAALTVAAAGADLDAAVLAGIGALSGSLHGGANRAAYRMVAERRDGADARAWARARIAERHRFPGYGHRVYKSRDPRARILAAHAEPLLARAGRTAEWASFAAMREEIETALGPRGIYANVDAISGLVYETLGLPEQAFTIPFCLAIQVGWMAHVVEYVADGGPVIEPESIYVEDPS